MDSLDKAKIRLKRSLERLQSAVQNNQSLENDTKINELEIENNDLRANTLLLKKELAEIKLKLKNATIAHEQNTLVKNELQSALLDLTEITPTKGKRNHKATEDEKTADNSNTITLKELKAMGDKQ